MDNLEKLLQIELAVIGAYLANPKLQLDNGTARYRYKKTLIGPSKGWGNASLQIECTSIS